MRIPLDNPKFWWKLLRPLKNLEGNLVITTHENNTAHMSMLDSTTVFYFNYKITQPYTIISDVYKKNNPDIEYIPGDPVMVNIDDIVKALQLVKDDDVMVLESLDSKLAITSYRLYYPPYSNQPRITSKKVEIQARNDTEEIETINYVNNIAKKLNYHTKNVGIGYLEEIIRYSKEMESVKIELYENNIKTTIYTITSKPIHTLEYKDYELYGKKEDGNKITEAYYTLEYLRPAISIMKVLTYEIELSIANTGTLKLSDGHTTTILIAPRISP